MKQRISQQKFFLIFLVVVFLSLTVPIAKLRPTGGRSGERQGQTAGMIRIYCQDSSRNFLKSPQVQFGNNPFNTENSIFEWLQGRLASQIDGPRCDSVEFISKIVSVFFGTLGILFIFLISSLLFGETAGLISAVLFSFDELWLRHSTYTMLDTRMVTFGLMAMYFTLKRKPILAGIFWWLQMTHKPQAFMFFFPFWICLELLRFRKEKTKLINWLFEKKQIQIMLSFLFASIGVVFYYLHSNKINKVSDLPWITWMGPRTLHWYFGDWHERMQFAYYKSMVLEWFRKTGLNILFPLLLISHYLGNKIKKQWINNVLLISSTYIFGRFVYSFIFYNVFRIHEYYALPVNSGSAIVTGCAVAYFLTIFKVKKSHIYNISLVSLVIFLSVTAFHNLVRYNDFTSNINNPSDWRYNHGWGIEQFPNAKPGDLVVMAGGGGGHDILPLYFTKKNGFAWCSKNPEFAPRKFWKESGVKYIAWKTHSVPVTGQDMWIVRTIEEELKIARENNWSNDQIDVWSSKSMSEWAQFASKNGYDPCSNPNQFNPQKWN